MGNGELKCTVVIPCVCILAYVKGGENIFFLIREIFATSIKSELENEIKSNIILCPKNNNCFDINMHIICKLMEGEERTYKHTNTTHSEDKNEQLPH